MSILSLSHRILLARRLYLLYHLGSSGTSNSGRTRALLALWTASHSLHLLSLSRLFHPVRASLVTSSLPSLAPGSAATAITATSVPLTMSLVCASTQFCHHMLYQKYAMLGCSPCRGCSPVLSNLTVGRALVPPHNLLF